MGKRDVEEKTPKMWKTRDGAEKRVWYKKGERGKEWN